MFLFKQFCITYFNFTFFFFPSGPFGMLGSLASLAWIEDIEPWCSGFEFCLRGGSAGGGACKKETTS